MTRSELKAAIKTEKSSERDAKNRKDVALGAMMLDSLDIEKQARYGATCYELHFIRKELKSLRRELKALKPVAGPVNVNAELLAGCRTALAHCEKWQDYFTDMDNSLPNALCVENPGAIGSLRKVIDLAGNSAPVVNTNAELLAAAEALTHALVIKRGELPMFRELNRFKAAIAAAKGTE